MYRRINEFMWKQIFKTCTVAFPDDVGVNFLLRLWFVSCIRRSGYWMDDGTAAKKNKKYQWGQYNIKNFFNICAG